MAGCRAWDAPQRGWAGQSEQAFHSLRESSFLPTKSYKWEGLVIREMSEPQLSEVLEPCLLGYS